MPSFQDLRSWLRGNASVLAIVGIIWCAVPALSGYLRSGPLYRLVFDIESDHEFQRRFAQVYYDTGAGYNERESAIRSLSGGGEGATTVSFDIPPFAHGNIRIDPVDRGDIDLVLANMRIVDPKGRTVSWIDMRQLVPSGEMDLDRGERRLRLRIGSSNNDPIMLASWDASIWSSPQSFRANRVVVNFIIALAVYLAVVLLAWASSSGTSGSQVGRWRILVFVTLTLGGFIVLVVRSPDAIFSPILYTEDGSWLSSIMTRGFVSTMIDARPDYFVWGNILALGAANGLNYLFNGDSVRYLPVFVALVSYVFYAGLFATAYNAFRPVTGPWIGLIAWLLMLLVPLGDSANEIYGRLSNIGYSVPVLVACLCIIRERALLRGQVVGAAAIDILFLVSACTNPLVIPMVGLAWLVDFTWRFDYATREKLKEKCWLVSMLVLLTILAAATAYRIHYFGTKVLGEPLIFDNFIPAFIGRMFLYPVVLPFYGRLNDVAAVLLFLTGLSAYVWALIAARSELRRVLLMFGLVLGVYSLSTMVMRPGITHIIADYSRTFPDRYYMGQSLLVLIVVCLVTRVMWERGLHKSSAAALALIGSAYLVSVPGLVEWNQPRLTLKAGLTYEEQVRRVWRDCQADAACATSDSDVKVSTYFDGWSMVLPRDKAESTANDLN